MFVDLAGEHIADIMTMGRSLASIPSASSILDTSNYTFQAISYGKDAEGFGYHAHTVLSPSSDGIIKVTSYGSNTVSSYSPRITASALSYVYKQYPESPKPTDIRLESKSTIPNYSTNVPDIGQYLNPSINPQLSAYTHLIGGFPSASGTKYKIFNSSGGLIVSGSLVGSFYNLSGLMDSSGFLTFAQVNLALQKLLYSLSNGDYNFYGYGAIRSAESGFPNEVALKWYLPAGDCGALNLFGGVYQIGLWCLDIKQMLKEGKLPPYSFNPLNNIRKYRLFAKKTFNRDLITYTDATGNSGFKILFDQATGWDTIPAIVLNWTIRFV
jgi:hypothetical protein